MAQSASIVRPPASQQATVVTPSEGTGGGGGGGVPDSSWQTYAYGDRSTQDLKTLLSGMSVAGDNGEAVQFTIASGVTASTVGNMAYVEWELKDIFGDVASVGISTGDMVRAAMQMHTAYWPELVRIGVGLTAGPIASATRGMAVGVQHNAADDTYYAWESRLATTWATINTSPAADPLTRGISLNGSRDEGTNRARVTATPFDADGEESVVAGGNSSIPATVTVDADGEYTRIQLLVGTVGNLSASYSGVAMVKSFCALLKDMAGFSAKTAPTVVPRNPGDGKYNMLFVGHSYVNAFNASSALSGQATSTGLTNSWTVRDGGSTITTWPVAGTSPNVGFIGYLLDLVDAVSGNTGGVVTRRAQNGDALGDPTETYFPMLGAGLLSDCTAHGITSYDLCVLYAGTNDANSSSDVARYPDRLRKWIRSVRYHSPNCIIVIPAEEPDVGSFAFIADIEAAKATVAAEFQHVYHLTTVAGYDSLDTSGHPSDAGHSAIATAIYNLIITL